MSIVVLNPTFSAILIPKDSTDIVIKPRMGKTMDIKSSVTESSNYLIYAAT